MDEKQTSWKWITFYPHVVLHSPPFQISFYPPKIPSSCAMLSHTSFLSLSVPQTFCKDCHHMFWKVIPQHVWLQGLWMRYMTGLYGPTNLGNSLRTLPLHHGTGPHRRSLLSVSPPHPSTSSLLLSISFRLISPPSISTLLAPSICPSTTLHFRKKNLSNLALHRFDSTISWSNNRHKGWALFVSCPPLNNIITDSFCVSLTHKNIFFCWPTSICLSSSNPGWWIMKFKPPKWIPVVAVDPPMFHTGSKLEENQRFNLRKTDSLQQIFDFWSK